MENELDISVEQEEQATPFVNDEELYGKKTVSVPREKQEIGVDTDNSFLKNIIGSVETSTLDMSAINEFTSVSTRRNEIYALIDSMANDALMSSALETYAEDCTEYNDQGRVVWAESSDKNVVKFVTYLLDTMNVDKNIYSWAYMLCMYGDVYLRLVRDSEFDAFLLYPEKERKKLDEEINIKAYKKQDHYSHYVEMQKNPANMFELTKFGKTVGYIKTKNAPGTPQDTNTINAFSQLYKFNQDDIELYPPTEFVHGCIDDVVSRTEEEVQLFLKREMGVEDSEDGTEDINMTYDVKRGQPLFYNVFKIWRELQLLENSVLLNRVTKSAIVRIVQMEVGDMPKEDVMISLNKLKEKIEQKTAINKGISMSEYNNPGPVENIIYVPTVNQRGTIQTSEIGGNPDVKSLLDLDYFKNKLWSALRIPKQFMGDTDDAAGFSGGESLARISSRYAKAIKKLQNVLCQMVTDACNLMLIDKGLDNYINKFTIRMQPPTTVEENERRDAFNNNISTTRDIMDLVADIDDPVIKLKILKSLLSTYLTNNEVTELLEEAIKQIEDESGESSPSTDEEDDMGLDFNVGANAGGGESTINKESTATEPSEGGEGTEEPSEEETVLNSEENNVGSEENTNLPSPEELGVDFTDNET